MEALYSKKITWQNLFEKWRTELHKEFREKNKKKSDYIKIGIGPSTHIVEMVKVIAMMLEKNRQAFFSEELMDKIALKLDLT